MKVLYSIQQSEIKKHYGVIGVLYNESVIEAVAAQGDLNKLPQSACDCVSGITEDWALLHDQYPVSIYKVEISEYEGKVIEVKGELLHIFCEEEII